MSTTFSTSTVLSSRPGMDPVFGRFGGLLRRALRGIQLQWFLYKAERRKIRPSETVGEMNAYLLRDIGAPDEMILATTRPAYERHGIPFGLSAVLVALTLAMAVDEASAQTAARLKTGGTAQAQAQPANAQMAGVFAGEYVNGVPVYRFPAVVVTGSRNDGTISKLQPCRQTLASASKSRA